MSLLWTREQNFGEKTLKVVLGHNNSPFIETVGIGLTGFQPLSMRVSDAFRKELSVRGVISSTGLKAEQVVSGEIEETSPLRGVLAVITVQSEFSSFISEA